MTVESLLSGAALTVEQRVDLDEHLQYLAESVARLREQYTAGVIHVCAHCQKEGRLVMLRPPILNHGICPHHAEAEREKYHLARAAQEDQEAEDRISPPIIEEGD